MSLCNIILLVGKQNFVLSFFFTFLCLRQDATFRASTNTPTTFADDVSFGTYSFLFPARNEVKSVYLLT